MNSIRGLITSFLLACSLAGCLKPVDTNPVVDNTTPVVSGSNLLIVIVENRMDRTKDSPQADLSFLESLRSAGHEFRIVEADNDYAAKFSKQVERHKIPCLLLVRKTDGRVLKSCPLPAKEEIKSLVTKYGAK